MRKLSSRLFKVHDEEDATRWDEGLNAWYQRWKDTVNEKTTAKQDPSHAACRKW
ncbi:hypothetical protein [Bifidobacterium sp. ESL0704]|uniref:hypothetical protein n=1 Tax=Bifidobacterium sp. ESL0704 TaxID=2983219 RepID=UPI0023F75148|nr:hypothetical protein [Bifidobacterium sp. ESL0704]WEV52237.1 hypothetical protein OZX64_04800 [Bifidobacterium sp. ESL0704]